MQKRNGDSRIMWRQPDPVDPDKVGKAGPLTGADLVDPQDPAFGHIVQAAMKLIRFGFNPEDPDMAQRAIEVGREDYERDPLTLARRSQRDSVEKRYGLAALNVAEVVYYMRIGNRVKIGWSTNLTTRLATLNPEELMATEPGDRALERVRHLEFRKLRTHGEWFRLDAPLTDHIARVKAASDTQERDAS